MHNFLVLADSLTENSTETDDKANKARDDKLISRQGQINTSVPRHSGHTTCCSPADSRWVRSVC